MSGPGGWLDVGAAADRARPRNSYIRTRAPFVYTILAGATIAAGLASRWYPAFFPPFFAKYAGDTLWAILVYWLLALVWRRASTASLAALALGVSLAVECSQLYHAAWIDAIRETQLGGLVLGYGFQWSDLACYAVGVALASCVDHWLTPVAQDSR
ncbi:MAG: DUF2809 domain-containing protein [Gemmatimonadota bacterium]